MMRKSKSAYAKHTGGQALHDRVVFGVADRAPDDALRRQCDLAALRVFRDDGESLALNAREQIDEWCWLLREGLVLHGKHVAQNGVRAGLGLVVLLVWHLVAMCACRTQCVTVNITTLTVGDRCRRGIAGQVDVQSQARALAGVRLVTHRKTQSRWKEMVGGRLLNDAKSENASNQGQGA